jgi:hypothetical protein
MSAAIAAPRPSLAGIALSLVLLCAGAGLILEGLRLLPFFSLHAQASAVLADKYWSGAIHSQLAPLRAQVAEWRDVAGVRSLARPLYMRLGQASGVPAATALSDAADVIRIDPVSGEAWSNFATASLAVSRVDLALAAWQMSSVVAPREDRDILWRLSFLAGLWREASDEQKQRFFYEVQMVAFTRGASSRFRTVWRNILRALPVDVREEIDGKVRALPRIG